MKFPMIIICATLYSVLGNATNELRNYRQKSPLTGIRGGKKISITQRPYVLSVITGDKGHFLGVGALLNKHWAITSAYSVDKEAEVQIRAGSDNAKFGGVLYNVSKIVIHPNYMGDWRYDVALLNLSKPVKTGNRTKTISLATVLPKRGAPSVVAGYGSTLYSLETDGALKQAVVPYIPHNLCKSKYNSTQASFTSLSFCASKEGVAPCPMDFGAPIVFGNKLYGIFSGSYCECGSEDYPAVYADLTQLTKWIRVTIKQ